MRANRSVLLLFPVLIAAADIARAAEPSSAPEPAIVAETKAENQILYEKLNQFRHGTRDYKDGYVIMNFILMNYAKMGQVEGFETDNLRKQIQALVSQHPDLKAVKELRLSEDRTQLEQKRFQSEHERITAKGWQPADTVPIRVSIKGTKLIAIYQFKIVFYTSKGALSLEPATGQLPQIFIDGQKAGVDQLNVTKTLTFKHRLLFAPEQPADSDVVLVCTNSMGDFYSGMTPDEDRMIAANGFRGGAMPWQNEKAAISNFCGLINNTGSVIARFPVEYKANHTAWKPLGITSDGARAGIILGKLHSISTEDGEDIQLGSPWDVWLWEDGKFSHKSIPEAKEHELRRHFYQNKL
jgi:hypothetical protein